MNSRGGGSGSSGGDRGWWGGGAGVAVGAGDLPLSFRILGGFVMKEGFGVRAIGGLSSQNV